MIVFFRRRRMDELIKSMFLHLPDDEPIIDQASCRAAVVEEIYRMFINDPQRPL